MKNEQSIQPDKKSFGSIEALVFFMQLIGKQLRMAITF